MILARMTETTDEDGKRRLCGAANYDVAKGGLLTFRRGKRPGEWLLISLSRDSSGKGKAATDPRSLYAFVDPEQLPHVQQELEFDQ